MKRFSNEKTKAWRYINEMSRATKSLGMHGIQQSSNLFNLAFSQQAGQDRFSNIQHENNLLAKKMAFAQEKDLARRETEMIPTAGEAFFNAVMPGAVGSAGNLYSRHLQQGMKQERAGWMNDLVNQILTGDNVFTLGSVTRHNGNEPKTGQPGSGLRYTWNY